MKKHINIPVFIPHLGCPNQCVFCNQKTISGVSEFEHETLPAIVDEALSTVGKESEAEIAFFGGSFTGIDKELMIKLLKVANDYVKAGKVSSVRCSTRPDYINNEILDILEMYSVNVIELGLQSSNDEVLKITKRNHTFEDEINACKLIKARGFSLIGQMMIGLPGSSMDRELATADFIINMGANGARIYPTVVFKDTELCRMCELGTYKPLTVDEAVSRTAEVLIKFIEAKIPVIRIGLCASENLSSDTTFYAGPNHPALGELVENEVFYKLINIELSRISPNFGDDITVKIPKGCLSKAIGQNKKNKKRLSEKYKLGNIRFIECDTISGYNCCVERKNRCI